jgi:hypothetical protein
LHVCLRGAVTALEADVNELAGFEIVSSDTFDNDEKDRTNALDSVNFLS